MNISAKTDYACKAILELAFHWPNTTPLQINTIAQDQKIPVKFLTQILINLKQLNLVESVRGQKGGYLLARAPKDITLKEVAQSFLETGINNKRRGKKRTANVFSSIWQDIEEETFKAMEAITFEEIVTRERSLNKVPMFMI